MPAARKLSAADKQRELRNLPDGVTRVQVIDEKGKQAWRKPEDVRGADQLVFGNNGPVVMRGSPGRKKAPKLEPVTEQIAEIAEAKEVHLGDDPLTTALLDDPGQDDVLDIVMRELAQEASSLEFERREAERNGRDTSTYSLRRARILQAVGDMFLKRKEKLEGASVDLDSPQFQAALGFTMETFRDVMTEMGMRSELIETTFAKMGKRLDDGWKAEAKARMKEAK